VIPESLLICSRTYTVTTQPMLGMLGACQHEAQDITIEESAHPQLQASVLLHEVLEAINTSMGLGLEHHVINALEAALYGVLTENDGWWEEA
jgi:hypothetical protein